MYKLELKRFPVSYKIKLRIKKIRNLFLQQAIWEMYYLGKPWHIYTLLKIPNISLMKKDSKSTVHYVLSIMSFQCRKWIIAENSCVIKIPKCSEVGVFVKREMIESNLYLYYCNEIRHRHTLSGCEFVRQ